jgi:mutator protein MutT
MDAIEVAAGLVFRDGKLLITQRQPDAHLGGLWEFPGGKRHAGERFEDCLRRELQEELDIKVEVLGLIESITHEYPERTVVLKFFHCTWQANEPRGLGCPAFRWVTLEQLAEHDFPAADARLLAKLRQKPELWQV